MNQAAATPEEIANVLQLLTLLRPFVQQLLEKAIDRSRPYWWDLYVAQALTPKIIPETSEGLGKLDLAKLLKVLTVKWDSFYTKLGVPSYCRQKANDLLRVRHKYSHVNAAVPTRTELLEDMYYIHSFAKEYAAPEDMQLQAATSMATVAARLLHKGSIDEPPAAKGVDKAELREILTLVLEELKAAGKGVDEAPKHPEPELGSTCPLTDALKGKVPKGISIQKRLCPAKTWKGVYEALLEDLVILNPSLFEKLPENPNFRGKGDSRYFTVQGDRIRLHVASKPFAPTKVKAELAIGTADFFDPKKRVLKLLKLFGIRTEDVVILV